jgi:hypothetical protein
MTRIALCRIVSCFLDLLLNVRISGTQAERQPVLMRKIQSSREAVSVAVPSRQHVLWSWRVDAIVLVVLVGLGGLVAWNAEIPANATQFTPPAVYTRWWQMTEACAERTGNLENVRWYLLPGSQFMYRGQPTGGFTSRYTHRIVLTQALFERGAIVRHEMLHALLRDGGHPRAQFLGSCASLVVCRGVCIKDAGPWHPPQKDYVVLPPDSLKVGVRARLLPRELDGQRWFEVEIFAKNPRNRALLVAFPGDPPGFETFMYQIRGPVESWSPFRGRSINGGEVLTDSSTAFFQPLETKRFVFDFLVASYADEHHVSPGEYLIRGSYARHFSAYDTVAVSP